MKYLRSVSAFILASLLFNTVEQSRAGTSISKIGETGRSLREVVVTQGDVRLAATILEPAESNGVGVVMLPGSGPATRSMIRPAGEQLLQYGLTVLIFDKRGSGDSNGDWRFSSLDDLAGDAIAAADRLRSDRQLSKVGLWAHSQGNWVATRAIELGMKPDFLIAVSGGGASPEEVERAAYQHKVSKFSPAQKAEAMRFVDSYFDYLGGELARTEFDVRVNQARSKSWFASLGIERVLVSESNRANWEWVANYDPLAGRVDRGLPILVVLGGADHTIPLTTTLEDWNKQLSVSPVSGDQIILLPLRGHHLNLINQGADGHGHGMTRDLDVWGLMGRWVNAD